MSKKAIAYVSDVILGGTGELIDRASQRREIERHARQEGIEIVAWFEDEIYSEDLVSRPGIKQLLACNAECQMVLVERVWALSRRFKLLQPFMEEMRRRGRAVETVTVLWDCVSQQCRNFGRTGRNAAPAAAARPARERSAGLVSRPAHIFFSPLVKAHRHA